MDDRGHKEAYKGWSIIVTMSAWPLGDPPKERFTPTVAVVPPAGLQQRFVDVGGGAAFLSPQDALRHGIGVAKSYIDLQP